MHRRVTQSVKTLSKTSFKKELLIRKSKLRLLKNSKTRKKEPLIIMHSEDSPMESLQLKL